MARKNTMTKKIPKEITMNYLKVPSYRSYHVDGAFGGISPNGNIYCEFFIERNVTPQKVVHFLTDVGTLGEEKERVGKEGLVREIESGIVFDINTACLLKDWLEEKIKAHKEIFKPEKHK